VKGIKPTCAVEKTKGLSDREAFSEKKNADNGGGSNQKHERQNEMNRQIKEV